MASFGLSRPWFAILDVETGIYKNGFPCGMAMSTSVTPNYTEAALHADNQERENINEFKNASVVLGTDKLPSVAKEVVFGHIYNQAGEEISKTGDSGNYVGYGFITAETLNSKKMYMACILLKVKFKEGEESYETKGDSIVFKTPTLNGVATGMSNGEWRIKSPLFETEDEADEWIQVKLNVKQQCGIPVASVKGGMYETSKSVSLSTATQGAIIKYTIDGTTPSELNGITYASAITVSKNTVIKAIANKASMLQSPKMEEEYIITA